MPNLLDDDGWGEPLGHVPEPEADAPNAHDMALRLLTRREHGAGELARKLRQRGVSREQAQETVAELAEQGWQSDARFAEQFACDHAARGDGPLKIRAAMQSRGVHESAVTEAIQALDVDWTAYARGARRKRFGTDLPLDAAEQARQQRFLMTRGFAASDARMAVRSNDDSDR
jgi:regulatory protein